MIAEFEAILKSPKKILEIIRKELEYIKGLYADERRTKIIKGGIKNISEEVVAKAKGKKAQKV